MGADFKFSIPHRHPTTLPMLYFLLTFMISSVPSSICEIKDTPIVDDSRPMILFELFGFAPLGEVSISIKHFSWKSSINHGNAKPNPSSMGFFLATESSFPQILNELEYNDSFCVLSSLYVKLIFKIDNLNGSVVVEDPGQYFLVFGSCQPEFEVTMDVHTEMYNLRDGVKDFLPVGKTQLPKLYFLFFLVYLGFFALWVFICTNQTPNVDKIHLVMGALLIFKALKMICASEDTLFVRKTGTPHGWDIAFYVFGFFKGIMLFTVIVLIGTGWSFLKPYLQEREKNVLIVVIPLQVLENVASVVINEAGLSAKDRYAWTRIFILVDVVCCCAVFFPIIWSVGTLKEASKTDGKAARNLEKLTLFKRFYVVVIGYLYFTRIVVPSLWALFGSYKFEWSNIAVSEVASLGFYVFIFYNFQPIEKNPYLAIDDEEEAVATQILQEEDESFDL
ncbi:protein CANDIDATE G-PROTEIN COUPLED RECEPTOR 7-like [Malania oleifera]|uniref:protein CANDIDATE G-PROTEIN COUPLED RECEPTOR 7-like n=1 Tax=Malania oleifera TaxID=397392 RepID=UPI0025AE70DD|nr:protein CANDIDATE G-PROTEIN COUPLED RECEPTOR 7-like [Malania oleifera]